MCLKFPTYLQNQVNMNPPPLPKAQKSSAQQCALCSLVAPLLAILVAIVSRALSMSTVQMPRIIIFIFGMVCFLLIVIGFVTSILGLCGISQHGSRGILGKSIAGLLISTLLLCLFGAGFIKGFNKALKSRQLTQNLNTTAQEMQVNAKQSYNSNTGITNTDLKSLKNMQTELNDAAQTLSGDDALVSQAMSQYLARMQSGLEKYQKVAGELREAQVLNMANLTNKIQIPSRREVVQNFIAINDDLKNITTNSENSIRANLVSLKISPQKIDSVLAGFDSKFAPRSDLDLQIRECDDRIGESMLDILDLLETHWGEWRFDAADKKIYFDDTTSRQTYQQSLEAIKFAGQEQIVLQGRLVNLPQ